jgi:alginate O-acetyltransferase complex protein AlgI
MLFNSFAFIFGFLPLTFVITYLLGRWKQEAAKGALTLMSLGFYAWWRPIHLPLLLGSIVFNYFVGAAIQRAVAARQGTRVNLILTFGLVVDLGALGWFKYANFVADNAGAVLHTHFALAHIALPLAISFFTFQKIAYLVDSARGDALAMRPLDFALFASFFPQLIAGPITHYKEIVPQINGPLFGRLIWRNVMVGLVIFAIGLFKKTVIADTLSSYANPLFGDAAQGKALDVTFSWLAAITFTLQLYFDFSGYSDMAIGLGRMFGVKLPLNFHSPLRARSITDYWRRWHMTLQRFIVAYIYQPLSLPLSRFAADRDLRGWPSFALEIAIPIFITFVLVGLWHGAGWTFILFGAMHGIYLSVNEAWNLRRKTRNRHRRKQGLPPLVEKKFEAALYHVITLLAIGYSNVMFRAASVRDALSVWRGSIGLNGPYDPHMSLQQGFELAMVILLGAAIIAFMPNTQQIMRRFDPAFNAKEWVDVAPAMLNWTWAPNWAGLLFAGVTLFLGVMFIQRGQAIFLYFNF